MDGFKRFFVDSPIRTSEIAIRGLGYRERMRPVLIDRPAGTEDYLLMVFYDPVVLLESGIPERFPAGTVVAWAPGERQYYGNRNAGFMHTWIHCDGRRVHDAIRQAGLPTATPIALSCSDGIEACAQAVHREMAMGARADPVVAGNLAENWVRELARACGVDGRPVPPERLEMAKRHIEAHCREPLALKTLASISGWSVPHFCAEFKRAFGFSAMDYAIRLRMAEAVHLLRDANLQVGEIAERVGFEDLYHFSTLCKKRCGVPPSALRARWQVADRPEKKVKRPLA